MPFCLCCADPRVCRYAHYSPRIHNSATGSAQNVPKGSPHGSDDVGHVRLDVGGQIEGTWRQTNRGCPAPPQYAAFSDSSMP